MDPTLFSPTRGLWLYLRGMRKRRTCGRRFGHFPATDYAGYLQCARCNTPLL